MRLAAGCNKKQNCLLNFRLEKSDNVPKYKYIADEIRKKIMAGQFKSNDRIPFEKELCVHYGASKMTVKRAMDMLVSEGLIIKRRGSGTFVKDLSKDEMENILLSVQQQQAAAYHSSEKTTSKILKFAVIYAPEIAQKKLNLDASQFVYDISRIKYTNDQPYAVEYLYMPVEKIPGLEMSYIVGSIYEYVEDVLKRKITSIHRTVTVRKATLMEAKHLELSENDPVAIVTQTGYLSCGQSFEFSVSVYRYDNFSADFVLSRD